MFNVLDIPHASRPYGHSEYGWVMKYYFAVTLGILLLALQGSKLSGFLFRESDYIFKSYLKVLCIETLQKFEGAAGEFNEALCSWLQLVSSPATL